MLNKIHSQLPVRFCRIFRSAFEKVLDGIFCEQGASKDSQNFEHAFAESKVVLDNGNQAIGYDGCVNLDSDRVFCLTLKKLTLKPRVNMFKYYTKKMEMYYDQVIEMHSHGCNIRTIQKKINLDDDTIRRWIRNFAEENKRPAMPKKSSQKINPEAVAKNSESDDIRELKVRIRQLEKQLKDEKLRADAYDMLITIAEEDFKIPIRKKGGAKR